MQFFLPAQLKARGLVGGTVAGTDDACSGTSTPDASFMEQPCKRGLEVGVQTSSCASTPTTSFMYPPGKQELEFVGAQPGSCTSTPSSSFMAQPHGDLRSGDVALPEHVWSTLPGEMSMPEDSANNTANDNTKGTNSPAASIKPISIGSVGHPHCCKAPCRYFRRKGGCRDGDQCELCHICQWSRRPPEEKPIVERSSLRCIPVPKEDSEECSPCSVGSIGHPHSCAAACKYHSKPAGCKDGKLCTRCHLCRWNRASAREDKLLTSGKNNQGEDKGLPPPTILADAAPRDYSNQTSGMLPPGLPLPSPQRLQAQASLLRTVVPDSPMYITFQ